MTNLNKIAVVILNWNGAELLKKFLPKVIQYSEQATIYVADNASTDDSIQVITELFPSVKIIINNQNYGFAKGYNEALKDVQEPYYCLLNSDVEVTENWLSPILTIFENESQTSIIQPKILDYKNKSYFEYAGAAGGFIDKFGYPYCRGRIFDTVEKDTNQYNDEAEIFWASGACFFIRKETYQQLKGFDDDFFAHQEEIDLCWRAFNNEKKIKYTSKSIVFHVGGATLDKANPKKTYLNFRNSLLMLTKNLPTHQLIPIIFTRLILDGIAGVQFIAQGKLRHCLAIIKAHFVFYSKLFSFLEKRSRVQNSNYYQSKSILYQYFIKKGKVFVR
ncbi:hypothetical protein Q361_10628 [Flavobacterium croceum DSM 17960]|uniref:Glycosyltransferase 2-like domain-containing protein n=1 Tax=Flavobacterium croceum DSM 17960 TaxID=1121886 RepID=A0A2S4N8D2_9FLAO|nr:glycosyltransferase family 2 protein [Flavobacterium croceum]POS01966.1 hypothetical protein Q361_10628 [Flavobacterium croceum DSM 17960]